MSLRNGRVTVPEHNLIHSYKPYNTRICVYKEVISGKHTNDLETAVVRTAENAIG
jgi:hypothetical protein